MRTRSTTSGPSSGRRRSRSTSSTGYGPDLDPRIWLSRVDNRSLRRGSRERGAAVVYVFGGCKWFDVLRQCRTVRHQEQDLHAPFRHHARRRAGESGRRPRRTQHSHHRWVAHRRSGHSQPPSLSEGLIQSRHRDARSLPTRDLARRARARSQGRTALRRRWRLPSVRGIARLSRRAEVAPLGTRRTAGAPRSAPAV